MSEELKKNYERKERYQRLTDRKRSVRKNQRFKEAFYQIVEGSGIPKMIQAIETFQNGR